MAGHKGTALIPTDNANEIAAWQLQIGSKLLPEYPNKSHASFFTP